MRVEERKTERVVRLLLETFPEHPRSETGSRSIPPEPTTPTEVSVLIPLVTSAASHGIWELNSPLSE